VSSRLFNVTFNALDPIALGRFWSAVTGHEIAHEARDIVRLRGVGGATNMLFMRVTELSAQTRVHVDIATADVPGELDRLLALGATPGDPDSHGRPRPRTDRDISWYVLRDPEGNEFCLGADPS
jgi:hypothetical protein